MPIARSHLKHYALTASNHPSIPPGGLALCPGKPVEVTAAQAEYVRTLPGVEIAPSAPAVLPFHPLHPEEN